MKKNLLAVAILLISVVFFYSVSLAEENNKLIITVFGEITAETGNNLISAIVDNPSVTLIINSSGGDVDSAISFYSFAKNKKTEVKSICLGTASSAATILFCCGKERLISRKGYIILHSISIEVSDPGIKQRTLDELNKFSTKIYAEIIASATNGKLSAEKVMAMMKEETFLSGEDAVKKGIATGFLEE